MIISVIGIAHEEIAIREQVSFTDQAKLAFQEHLYELNIVAGVILSTCNRSEVYVVCDQDTHEQVMRLYRTFFHLSEDITIFHHEQAEAIQHLFQVCAGLDSQILGEDQILKQVKDAYAFAQASHFVNKAIHFLFQEAFRFAKHCKQTLKMNEHPQTITYLVYRLLNEHHVSHAKVLLCGGGDVIQHMLPYVEGTDVTIAVRNPDKIANLLKQYPWLKVSALSNRYDTLSECDVLISATASPHPLFLKKQMPNDQHPRILFDLAIPRDIEVGMDQMSGYKVYHIDQIQTHLQLHQEARQALLMKAQEHVDDAVKACYYQFQQLQKEPVIAQMQEYLCSMAEDTYTLLNQKLTLSQHEQRLMKRTLDYSYLRFLQDFTKLVKESDQEALTLLSTWSKKGGNEA